MYAVIFKATIKQLDQDYIETARQMRKLAMENYGCLDFVSLTEGDQEIAISYWENEAQILAWKKEPIHLRAQQLGKQQWYDRYSVEVVEIKRSYKSDQNDMLI